MSPSIICTIKARRAWPLLLAGLVLCLSGCVQRRMMIRSDPPGATVYVDDFEIGQTPIAHGFTYYGTRKIRLVKDGYETLTVMQNIPAPWYQYPVVDFVSENLIPGEIRDIRELSYRLEPQAVVPPEHLLGRAEDLRRGVHAATGTAPPAMRVGPSRGAPEMIPTPQPALGGQPLYPLPAQ